MTAKWFSQSEDNQRAESMSSTIEPSSKKSRKSTPGASTSRLSATFTESRPWNFMTSAHSSDRSSSSSRKRLSLFGARSSTASSADVFVSEYSSPRDSTFTQVSRSEFPPRVESTINNTRPESRFSNDSKVTLAVAGDSWRSSIFSRKRSTKSVRSSDNRDEPFLRWLRGDSRTGSWRSSFDYDGDESSYHSLKKKDISAPFNFQHVTHTQQNQLPEMESVTDSELVSEFWAASAYQSPKTELRGIKAEKIDNNNNNRLRSTERPSTSSSIHSDSLSLRNGRLASMSSLSVHELDGTPRSVSQDAESPSDETTRSLSFGSRTQSLSRSNLPSRERLMALGAEQREPPTMVHPALRGQTSSTSDMTRSSSQGQVFEMPATSLESVPEEMEACGPSPTKIPQARAMLDLSPSVSPKQSPRSSPSLAVTAQHKNGLIFTPFPIGNAFAQAHGGPGAEVSRTSSESRLSFGADGNTPSLTSGESWENDIDFCYLVEAESSCDFDWVSIKSSRKGSEASTRRDSTASVAANRASFNDASHRASVKSQPDEGLFSDFDGCSNFVQDQTRHDSPHLSIGSRADLSPILESPAKAPTRFSSSETVGPVKPPHVRSISLDENVKQQRPLDRSARWSIASPLCLPEDAKRRGISFTHLTMPRPKRMSVPLVPFPAPALPPPQAALPPLPTQQSARPISPPVSPTTTTPPPTHVFPTMRRPSSSQDRAILQAAGRFVRNGRASSRPTTPSRLSHVQHAARSSPISLESPCTPTKTGMPEYKLGIFATPPTSPPEQHQAFDQDYPAWI